MEKTVTLKKREFAEVCAGVVIKIMDEELEAGVSGVTVAFNIMIAGAFAQHIYGDDQEKERTFTDEELANELSKASRRFTQRKGIVGVIFSLKCITIASQILEALFHEKENAGQQS